MTDYTELKRLAEAATAGKWESAETRVYFPFVAGGFDIRNAPNAQHNAAYIAAASPDVTLEMIDALDVQAGSIEAVQAANQRLAAERDKLRTQNQALVKEMRHIAGISNGQVKRVADQALAAQAEGKDV